MSAVLSLLAQSDHPWGLWYLHVLSLTGSISPAFTMVSLCCIQLQWSYPLLGFVCCTERHCPLSFCLTSWRILLFYSFFWSPQLTCLCVPVVLFSCLVLISILFSYCHFFPLSSCRRLPHSIVILAFGSLLTQLTSSVCFSCVFPVNLVCAYLLHLHSLLVLVCALLVVQLRPRTLKITLENTTTTTHRNL